MAKHAGGRPTLYSEELAEEICEQVMTNPYGIVHICNENYNLPSHDTVYRWLAKYPEFSEQYARAKVIQITRLVDTMLFDISSIESPDDVPKFRLWIDTIKWKACKLVPKVYGNKMSEDQQKNSHSDDLAELE
jgi:hypothetical protein